MGRASGAWVYEEIIRRVKAAGDVWICTRGADGAAMC